MQDRKSSKIRVAGAKPNRNRRFGEGWGGGGGARGRRGQLPCELWQTMSATVMVFSFLVQGAARPKCAERRARNAKL